MVPNRRIPNIPHLSLDKDSLNMMLKTQGIHVFTVLCHIFSWTNEANNDRLDDATTTAERFIPTIEEQTWDDSNDKLQVIVHPVLEDFVVYWSTSTVAATQQILYRYNSIKSVIEPLTLHIKDQDISIDKIIPSGPHMFCVAYANSISFLLPASFEPFHVYPINTSFDYVPNPASEQYIMAVPKVKQNTYSINVSMDFGQTYIEKFDEVVHWDWLSRDKIIIRSLEKLQIVTFKYSSTKFTQLEASDYILSQKPITSTKPMNSLSETADMLLIYQENGKVQRLAVYDLETDVPSDLIFPSLRRIKSIAFYDYVFGKDYLIIVYEHKETCLWSTANTYSHMVRRICWLDLISEKFSKTDIFISRRVDGIVYINHVSNGSPVTYMSPSYGRAWHMLTLAHIGKAKSEDHCNFDFSLYNPTSVPAKKYLVDIQIARCHGLQSYITLNGGLTWRSIPHSGFRALFLNHGSAILSVSNNSTNITYSLDHANTWQSYELYKYVPTIISVGKLISDGQKVLVISRKEDKQLLFTILNFGDIFPYECESEDFILTPFPKFGDSCFRGMNAEYYSRDPNKLCLEKRAFKSHYITTSCNCKPTNLECAMGYTSSKELCVLDPDARFEEVPINCKHVTQNPIVRSRYIRLTHDICDSTEFEDINVMLLAPENCYMNSFTNFLILCNIGGMEVVHLQSNGRYFIAPYFYRLSIGFNIENDSPLVFDGESKLIYTSRNGFILSYGLNKNIPTTTLYCVNARVRRMAFDPSSRILLYLTVRNHLRGISLLTNFEISISDTVSSFDYFPREMVISYIKESNVFCYGRMLGHHTCAQMQYDIIQSYIDVRRYLVVLLTYNMELIINRVDPINKGLQKLFQIYNVTEFVVHENNMYFLMDRFLFYRDLSKNMKEIKLYRHRTYDRIIIHKESWAGIIRACQSKSCQYMCNPYSYDDVRCICPASTHMTSDYKCGCLFGRCDSMRRFCRGYFCENGKCLLGSVRCNGVDDCGDSSDEFNCTGIENNLMTTCNLVGEILISCTTSTCKDSAKDNSHSEIDNFNLTYILIGATLLTSGLIITILFMRLPKLQSRRPGVFSRFLHTPPIPIYYRNTDSLSVQTAINQ